jgi:hypothetical protein
MHWPSPSPGSTRPERTHEPVDDLTPIQAEGHYVARNRLITALEAGQSLQKYRSGSLQFS